MVSTEGLAILYAIGSWLDQLEARLVDFEGYDVILGLSWFMRHNPVINWQVGTVKLLKEEGDKTHLLKSYSKIFNLRSPYVHNALTSFITLIRSSYS